MINDFLGYNYWDDGTQSLNNRLLAFRIDNGLSQTEIAKIIGVSPRTIERVEKNEKHISDKILKLIITLIE